uniref:Uncharacterized protein n=1 Tax=Lactuca sativa TaxID=4236 RepID=A0A9R1VVC1_LACSA|nr:hypothetical protein LSAT_V11C400209150 [Lactuca sativa]
MTRLRIEGNSASLPYSRNSGLLFASFTSTCHNSSFYPSYLSNNHLSPIYYNSYSHSHFHRNNFYHYYKTYLYYSQSTCNRTYFHNRTSTFIKTLIPPTPSTETTPILGGEDIEFDSTYFSPYSIQSEDDDDEPITKRHLKAVNDKLDQLLSSSSNGAYTDAALKALFSLVVAENIASLSAAAKAIEASTSQCQQASLAVDASTKECKEATAKVDKLVSEAHLFLDSLQAVAAKNATTVNTSVETLQKTLQSECSNLEAACHEIEEANESLRANVNERLTQLEADLAMENQIMDELDRRTAQLKFQTHKLRTANAEIDDLKSEWEVIRSSVADVHSILLHLIEASDPLITITVRRHLADKLRPALDVVSHTEGVPVSGVHPKQGGGGGKSRSSNLLLPAQNQLMNRRLAPAVCNRRANSSLARTNNVFRP